MSEEKIIQSYLERIKIVSPQDNEPYAFVSYKSDDRLEVYKKLAELSGKDVVFFVDKKFEEDSSHWMDKAIDAIESKNCKCVIAFVSDRYKQSYAALSELLYAGKEEKKVIFVDLDDLSDFTPNHNDNHKEDIQDYEKESLLTVCEQLIRVNPNKDSKSTFFAACLDVAIGLFNRLKNSSLKSLKVENCFDKLIRAKNTGDFKISDDISTAILGDLKVYSRNESKKQKTPEIKQYSFDVSLLPQEIELTESSLYDDMYIIQSELGHYVASYQTNKRYTYILAKTYWYFADLLNGKDFMDVRKSGSTEDDYTFIHRNGERIEGLNLSTFIINCYDESLNLFEELKAKYPGTYTKELSEIAFADAEAWATYSGDIFEVEPCYEYALSTVTGSTVEDIRFKIEICESFLYNMESCGYDYRQDLSKYIKKLLDLYHDLLEEDVSDKDNILREIKDWNERIRPY